jgi:hypothetical protein
MLIASRTSSLAGGLAMLAIVALLGWGMWLAIVAATGVREAWDHPTFFVVAVPLLIGASALAAYVSPRVKYFVGLAAIALQFGALLWQAPRRELPLAIVGGGISFGAIAVVCTFTAIVVGTVREKSR